MFGFTGTFNGERISVQGTGMGAPSISIYAYELFTEYNVQTAIRIGTCGGILDKTKIGDLIIAMSASTDSGINRRDSNGLDISPVADFDLLQKAVIKTAYFAKNLSIDELIDIKDEVTPALVSLVDLRSRFTSAVIDFQPSYRTDIFSLTSSELVAAGITPTTNHLSQMIFVEAGKNVICIPGDLEKQR